MYVAKEFCFEASHQIDGHFGKCARLHGHSWRLTVECEGSIDPKTGVVIDYYNIKEAIQPIIDRLDHRHLGEGFCFMGTPNGAMEILLRSTVDGIPFGFKPTSENLLVWIASQIPATLLWSELILNETCTSAARMTRTEFNRIWKGGSLYGRQEGHEERNEEGKESSQGQKDAQRNDEVTKRLLDRTEITDDDIPF